MSDELDPSTRDFLASALEDAPRLEDGARRRMRENVLTTIGAGAGVVAVAAAVKSAGASSAAATASIPAGAATASIPAGAATASIPAGAAATTTVAATAATKAVTLGFFAKAAIAVGVGGLVTTAAVWQSSKNDPPPPPPAPTVVMTSTPAPPAPVAEAKPVVTEPTPAPVVEEKPVVTAEAPKRAKVAVAEKPAPEEKPAAAATPAPTSTDFSKELDALDRARGALSGGDPAKALSVLDEGGGSSAAFVEERQALRIVALCSAGRGDEGRAALAAFRTQFPRSLQTARVTRACEPKAPVPTPAPGGVTPTKP